jgi:nucleotide-binding universal stress UspA family protein
MIAELGREVGARLVVVGTHARKTLPRLFLGSVAERTVLEADRPVLVAQNPGPGFAAWARGERPLRAVVGLDATDASRAAVGFVGELRRAGPVDVRFVHFFWPPGEAARLGLHRREDLLIPDPVAVRVLERDLRPLIAELPGQGKAELVIKPAWGSIPAALNVEATEVDADLLIIGTHQRTGVARLRLGSTVQPVLHSATRPVLCVPASNASVAVNEVLPRFRRVVVSTDFSTLGDQAVPYAFGLLGGERGHVILVHVHERGVATPPLAYEVPPGAPLSEERQRELRLRLQSLIPAEAERRLIPTEAVVIDGGRAADGINQTANRFGADAIVIASHGRTGLGKTLLGSVAQEVLAGAERPVIVIRSKAAN